MQKTQGGGRAFCNHVLRFRAPDKPAGIRCGDTREEEGVAAEPKDPGRRTDLRNFMSLRLSGASGLPDRVGCGDTREEEGAAAETMTQGGGGASGSVSLPFRAVSCGGNTREEEGVAAVSENPGRRTGS